MGVNESKRDDPREWARWRKSGALGSINGPSKTTEKGDTIISFPHVSQSGQSQNQVAAGAREIEKPFSWGKRLRYSLATSAPVTLIAEMLYDIKIPDLHYGTDWPYGYAGAVIGASTARFRSQEQMVFENSFLEGAKCTVRSLAPLIASGAGAYAISGGSVRDMGFNAVCAIAGRITAHTVQKRIMQ